MEEEKCHVRDTEPKISPLQAMHGGFFTWTPERKMVLMNLFAGPEWRADIENRLTETGGGGEEGEGKTNGVAWKHLHYLMKSRRPVGICYMTPRIQTGAL